MNNHREYLKRRFPFLAKEFDKIPKNLFLQNHRFYADMWDTWDDSAVLLSSFLWVDTPQDHDFWQSRMDGFRSREENESN